MQEIWKPIEGYEGQYEASNTGNSSKHGRLRWKSSGNWGLVTVASAE